MADTTTTPKVDTTPAVEQTETETKVESTPSAPATSEPAKEESVKDETKPAVCLDSNLLVARARAVGTLNDC